MTARETGELLADIMTWALKWCAIINLFTVGIKLVGESTLTWWQTFIPILSWLVIFILITIVTIIYMIRFKITRRNYEKV